MKAKPQLILTFVLMAVFCFVLVSSLSFPLGVRIYAWFAAVWGLIMSISYLVIQFRKQGGNAEASPSAKINVRRMVMWFGSIAGVMLGTWLFGYGVAALLFVLSYLKMNGRGWVESVGLTALVALLLWGFFNSVLHTSWIDGVVPLWLGF
ncbi:hypothetical protein ACFLTZ_03135 [Chloroflexota bacterium]